MQPADETEALHVDFDRHQLAGTVRGRAVVRVRVDPTDRQSRSVLRLRRFLSRLVEFHWRDLDAAGSPLGPAFEAAALPGADPRQFDHPVDLPAGAASREYHLEWALDPADHPRIGAENDEMVLFRVQLVGIEADGPETCEHQKLILISWSDADGVLRGTWQRPGRTPEPLGRALTELLGAPERHGSTCGDCHLHLELDRLLLEDAVWACQDGPELEEIRRLLVLRELQPDSGVVGYDTRRGHPEHRPHVHPDIAEELAAARGRHHARLLAYAPSEQPGQASHTNPDGH
ncbi:hypothetical protein GCM10010495_68940 [Kitasatospora herbaricolor]|uniref:hypothetical protein n=1 Tax=Kitasatospora herbaricolor TaxID=68217 RepID=UPI00174E9987|nr:hypothetical protein [Kitasatospora herbaricolor]MDQ0306216.1 hypothetical protein [Kitasatospora herbaricolor]GGV41600.1 hypothetical protein GCM10010495_68940 [Kitasatospora herbaricolor]